MALGINTNMYSLTAQKNLATTQSSLATSMQRLSSGLRINGAADDAAGLAISQRMTSQINGMTQASQNANDAISFMQTADGAASQITDNLQRMRDLAVQAGNGTYNSGDRDAMQVEFSQLGAEVSRIAQNTKFNNINLLASGNVFNFQVGAGTASDNQISMSTVDLQASTLGIDSGSIDITGSAGSAGGADAISSVGILDCALNTINTNRANFGAALNRTQAVISNLQQSITNQSAARGRITDTDFAAETANLSRSQILQQAGTAMLAQANAMPNNVMSLLK